VLVEKLRSASVENQDYVLKFCFDSLESLAEKPSRTLQNILLERLTAGDSRFQEALGRSYLWQNRLWDERVQRVIKTSQPAGLVLEEYDFSPPEDEDIPF
jgi:hypothetical protein